MDNILIITLANEFMLIKLFLVFTFFNKIIRLKKNVNLIFYSLERIIFYSFDNNFLLPVLQMVPV